jgi:hypothetical protein
MLFRFFDCGIYDGKEPLTTVWINAATQREASERVRALLVLTWNVPAERILIGGSENGAGMSESEITDCSPQPDDAGDRRLIECGCRQREPIYGAGPELLFLNAQDRARLKAAHAAARLHAAELEAVSRSRAEAARQAGRIPEAELYEHDADDHRRFQQGEH